LGVKITAVLETNVSPIPWYFWNFKKSTLLSNKNHITLPNLLLKKNLSKVKSGT
jgi:hypothetical protein